MKVAPMGDPGTVTLGRTGEVPYGAPDGAKRVANWGESRVEPRSASGAAGSADRKRPIVGLNGRRRRSYRPVESVARPVNWKGLSTAVPERTVLPNGS